MYADDLLLMSLSLHDLQAMVNLCVKEFEAIGLSVNISKSACLRIGPGHNKPIENLTINGSAIEWMTGLRYLGVTFLKSPSFKCNLQTVRQKYFKALNGIFGKIGANSSVTVTLSLINYFCTPILLYGIEALNVSSSVYNVLEAAYTAAFFKIFKTYDKQVVRQCQFFCGCLPLCDIIDKRRLSFLLKMPTLPNLMLSMMFSNSAKMELTKIQNKHNFAGNYLFEFNSKLWSNFTIS